MAYIVRRQPLLSTKNNALSEMLSKKTWTNQRPSGNLFSGQMGQRLNCWIKIKIVMFEAKLKLCTKTKNLIPTVKHDDGMLFYLRT